MRQNDKLLVVNDPKRAKKKRPARSKRSALKRRFIKEYERALGNISVACQRAEIPRATVYRWIDADTEFRTALEDTRADELKKDLIEAKFMELVNDGNAQVVIHGAKTVLRGRGYGEVSTAHQNALEDELMRLRKLIEARAQVESVSYAQMLETVRSSYAHLFKRELLERLSAETAREKNA